MVLEIYLKEATHNLRNDGVLNEGRSPEKSVSLLLIPCSSLTLLAFLHINRRVSQVHLVPGQFMIFKTNHLNASLNRPLALIP